jgi:glycosyltransferase involved in cell wall biosynthesis
VRERLPDARLHIVGSSTPKSIFAMACNDIVVHGQVAELAPLYESIRLSVAPLRFGAGLKGKVAESLGFGVPCVTTGIGVEGSGLVDGIDVLVADEPGEFAALVARAYTDAELWERLSAAGLAFVQQSYSIDANAGRFRRLFVELEIPHRPE